MPIDHVMEFDGQRLTGPLDDLYTLRNLCRRQPDGPRTDDEVTRCVRGVLDIAAKHGRQSHCFVANFPDGSRICFVLRTPPFVSVEAAARAALKAACVEA